MAASKAQFLYAEEPSLEQMWLGVQAEFQKATGDKGFDMARAKQLSIREVLEKANPPPPKDGEKHSARVEKAQKVLRRSLYVVNTFGQMAGQAASLVFGPSCLCVNAVSYLCDSVKNTVKIYEAMADLFERIAEFLEKFNVHVQDEASGLQVDNALRRVLHELLMLFSSICIKAIKIAKRPKLLQFGRVFSFGTDEGIQGDLDKFETLVARQTGLTAALILSAVSKEAREISAGFAEQREALGQIDQKQSQVLDVTRRLADGEKRNEQYQAEKEDRETIKKVLQINEDLAKEPWKLTQTECRSGEVKDSGSWLHSLPEFLNWKKKDAPACCIYSLKGPQSFGKTFLCSSVVDHLRNHYAKTEEDRRIVVASYYFKDGKSSASAQAADPVHEAVRALLWQLSLNDKVFEKSVSSICKADQTKGEDSSVEIWKDLLLERAKKIDTTVFIVLDSVDNAAGENNSLAEILRETQKITGAADHQLSVRIFLTGDKALDNLQQQSGVFFPVQALGSVNKLDLIKYVERRMDQITTLRLPLPGQDRNLKLEDLREEIRERLIAGAGGDYLKIEYKLQEISTKRYPTEIEEVLRRANEDREETIIRQLNKINESLRQDEIEELNQIIEWCIGGKAFVSVAVLEEALSVGKVEQSLIPLSTQIKDRYGSLVYMDDNLEKDDMIVAMHSGALAEYLEVHDAREDLSIAATNQTIQAAEVAIVRRFLGLVCDDELWKKFEFEDFFEKKLAKGPARVQYSEAKASFDLLMSCLTAIHRDRGQDLKDRTSHEKSGSGLLSYARTFLSAHVRDFKFDQCKTAEKKALAPLTWSLLTNFESNLSWADLDCLGVFQDDWLGSEEATDAIVKWFKDPDFYENLGDVSEEQKTWIKAFTSEEPGEADVLVHVARALAMEWVAPRNHTYPWHFKNIWCCLLEYLGKVKYRRDAAERKKFGDRDDLQNLVSDVVAFAKESLEVSAPDVDWTYTMAKTLYEIKRNKEATEKCREVLEVQPDNWRAKILLSQCLAIGEDWQAAIDQARDVMESHKNDPDFVAITSNQLLGSLEARQAFWYSKLKMYDEAVFWYRESQKKKPLNDDVAIDLLQVLKDRGGNDEIFKYAEEMHAQEDAQYGNRLLALSIHAAREPEFINSIAFGLKGSGKFDLFEANYLAALEFLSNDPTKKNDLFVLRSAFGAILFSLDDTRESAIPYFEKNVADLENKRFWSRGLTDWSIETTHLSLAEWYFENSFEQQDELLAKEHEAKFIQLCESPQYNHVFLRLMRARYHHLRGEQELLRKNIRSYIQDLVDMLSDDDPENDWASYHNLAKVLVAIDDDVNAIAGFYISGGLEAQEDLEKQRAEKKAKANAVEEDNAKSEETLGRDDINGVSDTDDKTTETAAPDTEPADKPTEEASDAPAAEESHGTVGNATTVPNGVEAEPIEPSAEGKDSTVGTIEEPSNNDAESDDSSSSSEEPPKPAECERTKLGFNWRCFGLHCDVEQEFIEDVVLCKTCADIYFCPGCYKKLMDGTLDQASCNKKHDHLYIPKMDRGWWYTQPRNMMMVGGELMKIGDWIDGIKNRFEIA